MKQVLRLDCINKKTSSLIEEIEKTEVHLSTIQLPKEWLKKSVIEVKMLNETKIPHN